MNEMLPRILILGPGRSGKDHAGLWFGGNTYLRFGGTTSLSLLPYVHTVMQQLGDTRTSAEVYEDRHSDREFWYRAGRLVRHKDHGILLRDCLTRGNVVGGLRDREEVEYAVEYDLVDHLIWIQRDVAVDPTLKYTLSDCADIICRHRKDVQLHVLINNGSKQDYDMRLHRLAKANDWLLSPAEPTQIWSPPQEVFEPQPDTWASLNLPYGAD